MTDEKIRRSVEKAIDRSPKYMAGYNAGFKAAERLAKIEVLEEVLSRYQGEHIDSFAIETMLSELKAASDNAQGY